MPITAEEKRKLETIPVRSDEGVVVQLPCGAKLAIVKTDNGVYIRVSDRQYFACTDREELVTRPVGDVVCDSDEIELFMADGALAPLAEVFSALAKAVQP